MEMMAIGDKLSHGGKKIKKINDSVMEDWLLRKNVEIIETRFEGGVDEILCHFIEISFCFFHFLF